MELDVNDRIRVVDHPSVMPGTCIVCGVAGGVDPNRKFIDFNFNIEFYGAVYFCTECLTPVAAGCGYVSKKEQETFKEISTGLLDTITQLQAMNRVLKDALVAVLCDRGPIFSPGISVSDFVSSVQKFASNLAQIDRNESNTDKSSISEESGSVRTDSNDSDSGTKRAGRAPGKS